MLRDVLAAIGRGYPSAMKEPFAGHPLARTVRGDFEKAIESSLQENQRGLLVTGSAGAGNWAEVPWGAVFDPRVTDTATRGYYVVYLFSSKLPVVFLSLNQGTTALLEEFGVGGYDILRERAALMRARLPEFANKYWETVINLGSESRLPRGYGAGHALGRKYLLQDLPDEASLTKDLRSIVDGYLKLTFRGGVETSVEDESEEDGRSPGTLIETRRYRMHRCIERNRRASEEAKKYHGHTCKACGTNFQAKYGELGEGYIEAHHLKPLWTLEEGASAAYNVADDFTVLCANCHRMIHRTDRPEDLDGFKGLIVD